MRSAAKKAVSVATTLGPRWTAQRSLVELRRRSGLVERQSPCLPWDSFEADAEFVGGLISTDVRDGGAAGADAWSLTDARAVYRQLSGGHVQVFDLEAQLGAWTSDPLTGFQFESGHWSTVVDGPGVDVKLVWEASRFGWALDLMRVAVLGDEPAAGQLFWSILSEWMAANPPNAGVNWRCGQESSIRLIHCLLVAEGLGGINDDHRRMLCRLADVTARRVLAFIDYAVSQNNNHSISEAMGLIAAASYFPDLAVAHEALDTGISVLLDGCRRLVFNDGSTAQYSMGYHRVFVEGLLLARLLLERRQLTVPAELVAATERSVDFLSALVDAADGSAPLYGEIDGGYLLALSSCPFADFRPTVALGHAVVGSPSELQPGPWSELCTWFGFDGQNPSGDAVKSSGPTSGSASVQVFRDAGVSVIRASPGRVTLRAGGHRFRPAQADQLHVDVWLGSHHVAMDPGTWSYQDKPASVVLKDTLAHNTVALEQRGQMPLLSQFLWGDWVTGKVTAADSAVPFVEATHDGYQEFAVSHTRRVEPSGSGWLVVDKIKAEAECTATVSWLLAGQAKTVSGDDCSIELMSPSGLRYRLSWESDGASLSRTAVNDTENPLAWQCVGYRNRVPATRMLLTFTGRSTTLLTTLTPVD